MINELKNKIKSQVEVKQYIQWDSFFLGNNPVGARYRDQYRK